MPAICWTMLSVLIALELCIEFSSNEHTTKFHYCILSTPMREHDAMFIDLLIY